MMSKQDIATMKIPPAPSHLDQNEINEILASYNCHEHSPFLF